MKDGDEKLIYFEWQLLMHLGMLQIKALYAGYDFCISCLFDSDGM